MASDTSSTHTPTSSNDGSQPTNASTSKLNPTAPATKSYVRTSQGRPKVNTRPPFALLDQFELDQQKRKDEAGHANQASTSRDVAADTAKSAQSQGAAESQAQQGSLPVPEQGPGTIPVSAADNGGRQHPPARASSSSGHGDADGLGWWTFTLPSKAVKKLEEYMKGDGEQSSSRPHSSEDEKRDKEFETTEKTGPESAFSMKRRRDHEYSAHQTSVRCSTLSVSVLLLITGCADTWLVFAMGSLSSQFVHGRDAAARWTVRGSNRSKRFFSAKQKGKLHRSSGKLSALFCLCATLASTRQRHPHGRHDCACSSDSACSASKQS